MDLDKIYKTAVKAIDDPAVSLPTPESCGEYADLISMLTTLIQENHRIKNNHGEAIAYIRRKVDQLLVTIGTAPLRPEELDDHTLLELDPIGVVAESFVQILEHLRETNESLSQTRNQLEAVFESIDVGIVLLDKEMRILAYNTGFQKIFGANEIDPLSMHCRNIVCQESSPPENCSFHKMMTTGETARFYKWPFQDRYLSVVASPIKDEDNRITGGVLLYQDITEQIKATVQLGEEKERLAITLRSIAEGVITMNTDNQVFMMNKVAEKLTGYEQNEAFGLPADEIFWLVDQKQRNQTINLSGDILQQKQMADSSVQGVLISREGDERLIIASAAPIRDSKNIISGVVIVFRDITEEKRLEKEIINARRLESMGVLAGGIAHDFNNLLTGILGNISLARIKDKIDDRSSDRLLKAEQACHRAKDLTHQLLTFARGGEPIRKVMSIAELIKETSLFILRGTNINCQFDMETDLWRANIDKGQIGQVIQNLVLNAYQSMPQGGIITIRAENLHLEKSQSILPSRWKVY